MALLPEPSFPKYRTREPDPGVLKPTVENISASKGSWRNPQTEEAYKRLIESTPINPPTGESPQPIAKLDKDGKAIGEGVFRATGLALHHKMSKDDIAQMVAAAHTQEEDPFKKYDPYGAEESVSPDMRLKMKVMAAQNLLSNLELGPDNAQRRDEDQSADDPGSRPDWNTETDGSLTPRSARWSEARGKWREAVDKAGKQATPTDVGKRMDLGAIGKAIDEAERSHKEQVAATMFVSGGGSPAFALTPPKLAQWTQVKQEEGTQGTDKPDTSKLPQWKRRKDKATQAQLDLTKRSREIQEEKKQARQADDKLRKEKAAAEGARKQEAVRKEKEKEREGLASEAQSSSSERHSGDDEGEGLLGFL